MIQVIKVTTVPFDMARLQTNVTQNIFHRAAGKNSTQSANAKFPILTPIQNINISSQNRVNTQTSRTLNDRLVKKRNKILRNRLSAKVSREKWKLHKDLLEQQLKQLKMEKLRLLTENEQLRLKHNQLEKESDSTRMSSCKENEEEGVAGDALEHASFVSIPLLKEWALPHITLLMMLLTKVLDSCQFPRLSAIYKWRIFKIFQSCLISMVSMIFSTNQICQLKCILTFQMFKTSKILMSCLIPMMQTTHTRNQMFLSALCHKT